MYYHTTIIIHFPHFNQNQENSNLKQNIEIMITENQNHSYKIAFIDESNFVRERYVARRNLKIINLES